VRELATACTCSAVVTAAAESRSHHFALVALAKKYQLSAERAFKTRTDGTAALEDAIFVANQPDLDLPGRVKVHKCQRLEGSAL
jgi:hypothetical protein